jgi:mono/diheme cytochrome c family protein
VTVRALTLLAVLGGVVSTGCSERPAGDALSARGRQIYQTQCTTCHGSDPAQPGALGPAVKGSSPELLEARLVRGDYPPGYTPKRQTKAMPPQPALAPEIPALAAYLR